MSASGGVLSRYARQVIVARGVKVGDYMTHVNGSSPPVWYGDTCGCPDDRCSGGYHHDGGDDQCNCLPAVLDQMLGQGVWAAIAEKRRQEQR